MPSATQAGGRVVEASAHGLVELPEGAGTPREGGRRRGRIGALEKQPRLVRPSRSRDGEGRGAEVVREQATQLPLSNAESGRERADGAVVESARLDEPQGARNGGGRPHPARRSRRRLGAAAQAGPEARPFGRGGAREEDDVLAQRRPCRADWTAIDPGRSYADEEPAVEAGVAGAERAIADFLVEKRHGPYSIRSSVRHRRFSDVDAGPCPARKAGSGPHPRPNVRESPPSEGVPRPDRRSAPNAGWRDGTARHARAESVDRAIPRGSASGRAPWRCRRRDSVRAPRPGA